MEEYDRDKQKGRSHYHIVGESMHMRKRIISKTDESISQRIRKKLTSWLPTLAHVSSTHKNCCSSEIAYD
jgi:hypothetical protein